MNKNIIQTLIPFVSSSSKLPMSKASAALTSPRGGMSGGVYFWWYTCCQSMPAKNTCSFTSSALLPIFYIKEISFISQATVAKCCGFDSHSGGMIILQLFSTPHSVKQSAASTSATLHAMSRK